MLHDALLSLLYLVGLVALGLLALFVFVLVALSPFMLYWRLAARRARHQNRSTFKQYAMADPNYNARYDRDITTVILPPLTLISGGRASLHNEVTDPLEPHPFNMKGI
jgi:hypothetical protein